MRSELTTEPERRSRSTRRLFGAALVVLAIPLLLATSGAAASGTAQKPVYRLPQSYYLALGDSMAYGIQPQNLAARPSAVRTGYVDMLAARLRKLSPKLVVVNYGCPGESTITFVNGRCPWLNEGRKLHDGFRGTQLQAALAFLRAHPGKVSPITLSLWGNDLPIPLSYHGTEVPEAIATFSSNLGSILRKLRAAAPRAEIIVSGAWNPEADRIAQGERHYRAVDRAIARVAAASGARVANTFAAMNGRGDVRAQQARLCRLSHFCSKGDPHPTDAGYRAMANAFMAASGYPRKP